MVTESIGLYLMIKVSLICCDLYISCLYPKFVPTAGLSGDNTINSNHAGLDDSIMH